MQLRIDQIRMDGGTQPRARLSIATIDEYAQAMMDGMIFPPVEVYHDGIEYWLADGFHRVQAALKADMTVIEATVTQGTVADAQWHSFSANKAHGLQRTNEDKEQAVRAALRHAKAAGLSDREIARHLGVHGTTVGKYRAEMVSSAEIQQIDTRTVSRGDSSYKQATANIGKSQKFKMPSLGKYRSETQSTAEIQQSTDRTGHDGRKIDAATPPPRQETPAPRPPAPTLSVSLPLGNPKQGAREMFQRLTGGYLRLLVRELRQLLDETTE